jgi:hypothetical protein
MTTETYCGAPDCTRPTTIGVLCNDCHNELTHHIDNLPWALEQLQNAATNQTRFTTGGGAKSTETPLMFNPFASGALASLIATVQIWQGRLADHTGQPIRHPNPIKAAKWMGQNISSARTYINAGQMLDALTHAHEHVEKVINKPPQRQYLGDCADVDNSGHTCPGRMFAYPNEAEARCDTCTKEIDAATRRLELLRKMDDKIMSAAEIARIATYMGLTIDRVQVRKRINKWHSRHRITPINHDADNPTFRFLEVRLLLEQDEETRQSA